MTVIAVGKSRYAKYPLIIQQYVESVKLVLSVFGISRMTG